MPSALTTISANAFQYCWSLKELIIPSSVTAIGNNSFYQCFSLHNVKYTGTITTAADASTMFYSCERVDTLNWKNFKSTNFSFNSQSGKANKLCSNGIVAGDSIPIRIDYANSFQQAAATAGTFDLSYNSIDTATIVHIFKCLPSVAGTNKTINVKGNPLASALTAAQRLWATAKRLVSNIFII